MIWRRKGGKVDYSNALAQATPLPTINFHRHSPSASPRLGLTHRPRGGAIVMMIRTVSASWPQNRCARINSVWEEIGVTKFAVAARQSASSTTHTESRP